MKLNKLSHVGVVSSDYEKSKNFYVNILGLTIIQEIYNSERNSFRLDLALNDEYVLEIFGVPNPPRRMDKPETAGLRHLAFEVTDIESAMAELTAKNITVDAIKIDKATGKKFTFFKDPDNTPIEIKEV